MSEADTQATAVAIDPNAIVIMQPQVFHFKTEKLRNEAGAVVGEGKKHPSVTVPLPIPTANRLAEMLLDPVNYAKEVELILATVTDQVYRVARSQINDYRDNNKDAVVTAASINYDKLDWTAIANMPKSERASTVPADEDIKAFLDSYLEVMPAALNKPIDKVTNHIVCFQTTFKKQRSQKDILEAFQQFLTIYTASADEAAIEEHSAVIEYYNGRLEKLLATEEKITMDSL
jgi:hypothetical protein